MKAKHLYTALSFMLIAAMACSFDTGSATAVPPTAAPIVVTATSASPAGANAAPQIATVVVTATRAFITFTFAPPTFTNTPVRSTNTSVPPTRTNTPVTPTKTNTPVPVVATTVRPAPAIVVVNNPDCRSVDIQIDRVVVLTVLANQTGQFSIAPGTYRWRNCTQGTNICGADGEFTWRAGSRNEFTLTKTC